MKRRIHFGFVLVCLLVSHLCPCSAFYLPGLAPVSFCESGKSVEDCQVSYAEIVVTKNLL